MRPIRIARICVRSGQPSFSTVVVVARRLITRETDHLFVPGVTESRTVRDRPSTRLGSASSRPGSHCGAGSPHWASPAIAP